MSEERIKKLASEIKNHTFTFKPARRILILKPEKNTMRSLTIQNFHHRIIQEVIRIILNAIYDMNLPIANFYFGFRPKLSTYDAINSIIKFGKATPWTILFF